MRRLVLLGLALVLAACSSQPEPLQPGELGRELSAKVTTDGMMARLGQLSDIAKAHQNTRAVGTPGYDASVDYVAKVLRDSGFDVETPEFERVVLADPGKPTLAVGGRTNPVEQASLLVTTPPDGLSAVTLRPKKPAGCSAADYGTANVRGALAVVDDTACSVVAKHDAAVAAGAVGVLVVSDAGRPGLFVPGYYQRLKVPVAVIGSDVDAQLRRTSAQVRLVLNAKAQTVKSRNVLAQTKTGDAHNVVVVGAHLGSAPNSPGMNDSGSGVAAVLETAAQLGASPSVTNAVRFAFWGSDEARQEGSTTYVAALDRERVADIAMYLSFDMLASKNAGYFTLDGDQSGQANPDLPAASVPDGSAAVERTLAGYLNLAGVRPADTPLTRASDYGAFMAVGIPVGGITTGASQPKSAVQARLWGGIAGQPFDPAYRSPRDLLANVNPHTLSITGPAVGFAVGTYAESTDGVNGVPAR